MDYLLYSNDPVMTTTATSSNLKRPHSLDLEDPPAKRLTPQQAQALLGSPDLSVLKLTSPELEKMLISHAGMVTTPTPVQINRVKGETEEQAKFAQGFVEALKKLHAQNQLSGVLPSVVSSTGVTITSADAVVPTSDLQTVTALPGSSTTAVTMSDGQGYTAIPSHSDEAIMHYPSTSVNVEPHPVHLLIKQEDPQTVPQLCSSPELVSVDLGNQERMKLERKRLRNREAARRCRNRKLDRITNLEDRVKSLKGQNSELVESASKLREEVCRLKQQIMQHVKSGCQIMVAPSMKL